MTSYSSIIQKTSSSFKNQRNRFLSQNPMVLISESTMLDISWMRKILFSSVSVGSRISSSDGEYDKKYKSLISTTVRRQIWPNHSKRFDLMSSGSRILSIQSFLRHGDKKPEYAIRIFQDYIKPKFPEATLHLLNQ